MSPATPEGANSLAFRPGAPGLYWLASYPKSGNTWMRAFIAALQDGPDRPLDINRINVGAIASSRDWLDDVLGADTADLYEEEVNTLRPILGAWACRETSAAQVRVYQKVHDARRDARGRELFCPEACGALVLVRNPLDIAASGAHHWGCPVDDMIERMNDPACRLLSGLRPTPQVQQFVGDWSSHVLSWIEAPPWPLLVLRYEDMVAAPARTFGRAADFLGLPADEERRAGALRACAFDRLAQQEEQAGFRERAADRAFFRRGRSGGWREELEAGQVRRLVERHAAVMRRFGYLDDTGAPI